MKLHTNKINPRLLKCTYFNSYDYPISTTLSTRKCYDYEIEFFLRCDGGIIVNDKFLAFKANEINIRKPGQIVQGVIPYECFTICINMKGILDPPDDYIFGSALSSQPLYENPLLSPLPDKLIAARPDYIHSLINVLYQNTKIKSDYNDFQTNVLLYNIIFELFKGQNYEKNDSISINKHVINAAKYIKNNFSDNIKITDLIIKSGISKANFHKYFKEYTGTTPIAMLINLRMKKAKTMLSITDNKIS